MGRVGPSRVGDRTRHSLPYVRPGGNLSAAFGVCECASARRAKDQGRWEPRALAGLALSAREPLLGLLRICGHRAHPDHAPPTVSGHVDHAKDPRRWGHRRGRHRKSDREARDEEARGPGLNYSQYEGKLHRKDDSGLGAGEGAPCAFSPITLRERAMRNAVPSRGHPPSDRPPTTRESVGRDCRDRAPGFQSPTRCAIVVLLRLGRRTCCR